MEEKTRRQSTALSAAARSAIIRAPRVPGAYVTSGTGAGRVLLQDALHEERVERPPMFPPTFLYTQSWEDPEPDMEAKMPFLGGATTTSSTLGSSFVTATCGDMQRRGSGSGFLTATC
ncbi:hypothetical protein TSOC_010485, partial [Tetrabaena socialis]